MSSMDTSFLICSSKLFSGSCFKISTVVLHYENLFCFFFFLSQEFSIDFVGLGLAIYTRLALSLLRSTYSDSLSVGLKVCTTTPGSCSDMWRHVNLESQVLLLASFLCMRPLWYSYSDRSGWCILTECLAVLLHSWKKSKGKHISLNVL